MTDIDEELAALYRSARAQEAPTRADRMAVQAGVAAALATTAAATSAQAAGSVATSQLVKVVTVGKIAVWLCAAGQLEAAETARQRFLGTYPHSPHEARVRGNCAKQ
jgi:hypothetical protein